MKRSQQLEQQMRRTAHFHNNLLMHLILLLSFTLNFVATSATPADLQGADGSSQQKLMSQRMGSSGCLAWRSVYLPSSTRNIELLLQGWCRHYWRSMASVSDSKAETDYLGDYSPSPNVDRGVVSPLPSPIHVHIIIGNKRKLLRDYSPMANTNRGRC